MIAKLIHKMKIPIKVRKPMAFVRMQQSMGLMLWMATPESDAELTIDKKFVMVPTQLRKNTSKSIHETIQNQVSKD